MGAVEMFFTVILVTTMFFSRLVTGLVNSTSAWPLIGGVSFLPARTDCIGGAWAVVWAFSAVATALTKLAPTSVAAKTERARTIGTSREWTSYEDSGEALYTLHFAVPVLGVRVDRAENLHVPLAAAPGLDDLGGDHIDENLGEQTALGVALQMVRLVVPAEGRVQEQCQRQIVSIVAPDQLTAAALQLRLVDKVFFCAVRADVALQRELARDDLLDCDLLVPAVAAVFFLAARL